jgi:ATP-binding cassette subfamily B protein/subfamily B ATP-binding cassette protein MsbA
MQGDAALPYSLNTASRGDAADGSSGSSAARMEFFISLLALESIAPVIGRSDTISASPSRARAASAARMTSTGSRVRFREYLARRRLSKGGADARKPGSRGPLARQRSAWSLFLAFLGFLRPHAGAMGVALLAVTFGTILALAPPAATKLAIDYAFTTAPLPAALERIAPASWDLSGDRHRLLAAIAIGVVVLSLGRAGFALLGRWQATRTTKRLQVGLRRRVYEHAVRLPLHRVVALRAGGAASILREDAGGVGELVFSLIVNPWRAIVQLLGTLAILAWTDWRLLVGALGLLPLVWFSHRTWIGRIRPLFRDQRETRTDIDAHAAESFSGMRVVRGFARERSEAGRFVRGNHLLARQEFLTWWWSRGIELAWEISIPIASAVLLFYGGGRVIDGTLTTGDLVMFLSYLLLLFGPLEALANSATQFQTNLAALDRVLDLVAEPQELPDRPGARHIDPGRVRGRVAFEGVRYRYPGSDRLVLDGIDFVAAPGTTTALVGRSGAGKTTICNLVARFDDPSEGRVLLDGVDLRDYALADYRRLLGIVDQEVFLFDGTIAENIAYGRRDATPDEIRAAARAAYAEEFVDRLERGYATRIGERGVRLSGGQRQRIAIARAILADPRILILDEATSNLDTESELAIQAALKELMRGRTSFVIAHRLSTIVHADRIVVLDGGRIVETGTHAELMASSGRYREMVVLQTAGAERMPPP